MAGRIPCTCGCGKEVTYTTKRKHLNASGKTDLRARIVAEVQSLKRITRQQREPTPPLQRGFRKRASSNPDQDGSRKKRKVAQIKGNQSPKITASSQADTDLMGDLLPLWISQTFPPSKATQCERTWFISFDHH
jgi:hypothetical protein